MFFCVEAFFPIWMSTLGQWIASDMYGPTFAVRFPIVILDIMFAIFFVPSVISFVINYKCPRVSSILCVILRLIGVVGTLSWGAVVIWANSDWFFPLCVDWTIVASPFSASLIGYLIGFLVAILVGRLPVDKAVVFSAQSGVANAVFAIFMSVAMLEEPDGDIAYQPPFYFGISSIVIAALLVPTFIIGRRLVDRYWPETFSLKSTDRRLENEYKRAEEENIRRNVSLISEDFRRSIGILLDDERQRKLESLTSVDRDDNHHHCQLDSEEAMELWVSTVEALTKEREHEISGRESASRTILSRSKV